MNELKAGKFTFVDRDALLLYHPHQLQVAWVRPSTLFDLFQQDSPTFAAETLRDEEKNIKKREHWENKAREEQPVMNMAVVGYSDADGTNQGEQKLGVDNGRHRIVVFSRLQQSGELEIEKMPVLVIVSEANPTAAQALEQRLEEMHRTAKPHSGFTADFNRHSGHISNVTPPDAASEEKEGPRTR